MHNNQGIFGLSGKLAVVTGADGVLGRIFCSILARNGCTVAALDKPTVFDSETLGKIKETNQINSIYSFGCDISNPSNVSEVIQQVVKDLGPIHILVNNAATKTDSLENFYAPFEDYSLETWKQVMSVNIDGMFLIAQAVGKVMLEYEIQGSIIQVSSIYGILGPHHDIYENSLYQGVEINSPAVYSASKAAVIGLTKYLATYWGKKNIRVNSLVPGGVSSGQNNEFSQAYANLVPMNRMGEAKELEAIILLLASDNSSYITGQNFVVDGGFSIW